MDVLIRLGHPYFFIIHDYPPSKLPTLSSTTSKSETTYPPNHFHTDDTRPHPCTPVEPIDTRKAVELFRKCATRRAMHIKSEFVSK